MKIKQWCEREGSGADGEVWAVIDELDRRLAVKFLNRLNAPRNELVHRAKALTFITHPNVVRVYGVFDYVRPGKGDETPEAAIVMDYAPGTSLADWLESTSISSAELVAIADQILDALDAFHAAKRIHGDLHSGNIRIHEGNVVVIDPATELPSLALSSISLNEGIRRDLQQARWLLNDIFIRGNADSERFGSLCAADIRNLSLAKLREYVHEAIHSPSTTPRGRQPSNEKSSTRLPPEAVDILKIFIGRHESDSITVKEVVLLIGFTEIKAKFYLDSLAHDHRLVNWFGNMNPNRPDRYMLNHEGRRYLISAGLIK